MRLRSVIIAGLVLAASPLGAQAPAPTAAPAPPAAAAPAAQAATAAPAKPFPFALALEAAQAAAAACTAAGMAAAVEVMDTAYNPKVILVPDGTQARLIDFARRKAYTVIKTGVSTADFAKTLTPDQGRGGAPINGDANLITFQGGLPIKINGELVAAISVSGPRGGLADEPCVKAGLDKIQDRLK